jgi:copper chaperone CopZ
MSSTTAFAVEGMSCGHCEQTVIGGLSALHGVTAVTADAKAGRVSVTGQIDQERVRAAVDEAGFTLAGRH